MCVRWRETERQYFQDGEEVRKAVTVWVWGQLEAGKKDNYT